MAPFDFRTLPTRNSRRIAVRVRPKVEKHIRSGHPWLFADSITSTSHQGNTGDHAVIFDRNNKFLAIGLWDAGSKIPVKLLHAGSPTKVDTNWLKAKLTGIFTARDRHFDPARTNGYRLIHGENDGLPDLVIDRYASVVVIKLYSAIWLPDLETVCATLQAHYACDGIVLRLARRFKSTHGNLQDGMCLAGVLPAKPNFLENGIRFNVDPVRGQKTGFFLDQRDNRAKVGTLSKDKTLLNVFSYSGGFSLTAAQHGATAVTSLDISQYALTEAEENFALNANLARVAACQHETLADDAFSALTTLARQNKMFDVVVTDPPSFANKQADVPNALAAYARLNKLAAKVVKPKGILVAASCSSRITREKFFEAVFQGLSQAQRQATIIDETFHAVDHPIGFAEGGYLKCLYLQLD